MPPEIPAKPKRRFEALLKSPFGGSKGADDCQTAAGRPRLDHSLEAQFVVHRLLLSRRVAEDRSESEDFKEFLCLQARE